MILSVDTLKKYVEPVDHLSYRGFEIDFYEDVAGRQLVAVWEDKVFEFGVYNTMAKEDMKLIIDDHLDTITRFKEQPAFHGAKLEYFQNGSFSDVRLIYQGRILRVFLNPKETGLSRIEDLAVEALLEELHRQSESDLNK